MGILSWFEKEKSNDDFPVAEVFEDHVSKPPDLMKSEPPKQLPEPGYDPSVEVTFDDIAKQFDLYRTQALDSQNQITSSLAKLQQTLAENANLTTLVQQLRHQNQNLHSTIKGQGNEISNLHHMNKQLKGAPKPQSSQVPGLNGSGHKSYANLLAEHEKLQNYTLFINERMQVMQFELELMKCTRASESNEISRRPTDSYQMQLTPQPFVVVLVDGDAYAVSNLLGNLHCG